MVRTAKDGETSDAKPDEFDKRESPSDAEPARFFAMGKKVEIRAGEAVTRVVAKVEKQLAKVVEAKAAKRLYRDLANVVEGCIHEISANLSWNRRYARIASCRDT